MTKPTRRLHILAVLISTTIVSCDRAGTEGHDQLAPPNTVPQWAKYAVWYQIFPERFRNGDPSNDPTAADIVGAWPNEVYDGWTNTPWTHDWYQQEPWAKQSGFDFYVTNQSRRYGGDLQGIIDQLDYLDDLGITALYLNPTNDSPSLHKYDARYYHHIDHNLGPDPEGDMARIATENPIDPATWKWTSADSLMVVLIDEVHRRGMRIILDYSWNHTGKTFWAFRDAIENEHSPYRDWYVFRSFDDPNTEEDELDYQGWFGVRSLPEIREIGVPPDHQPFPLNAFEGTLPESFTQHALDVTQRWMDPNGDGDPADGVDGYRLDVAGEIPLGFWRRYRSFVKGINPDAYLVGEIWWEQAPDRLADPNPWLGPVFDAVTNYRWYPPSRSFLNGAPMFAGDNPLLTIVPSPSELALQLDSVAVSVPPENARVMMNMAASHDAPRLSSSIYNSNGYKQGAKPQQDRSYKVERPDRTTFDRLKMLLALQFAYIGAPHIWNGDELGMWGADDPDNRKPVIWPDLEFDDEVASPFGLERPRDPVKADTALLAYYKRLIAIRKAHTDVFVEGNLTFPVADDVSGVLVMSRQLGNDIVLVALNRTESRAEVRVPVSTTVETSFRGLLSDVGEIQVSEGMLTLPLGPVSALMVTNRATAIQP